MYLRLNKKIDKPKATRPLGLYVNQNSRAKYKLLLFLMSVFPKTFFPFMGGHFMPFSFLSAWHLY